MTRTRRYRRYPLLVLRTLRGILASVYLLESRIALLARIGNKGRALKVRNEVAKATSKSLPDFQVFIFLYHIFMEFIAIAKAIALFSLVGPGIAIGLIGGQAMRAIGRNPNAANAIKTSMLLALAFAEFLGLLAFLSLFLIK